MKRVYVCGPMTGYPSLNFPAFNREAKRMRALGYEVINPAEICPDPMMRWEDCMRADIPVLITCDAVVLLPGWERSRGATLERHIAEALGMRISLAADFLAPAQAATA